MASPSYNQEPSAPPMYPDVADNTRPIPPNRHEFDPHSPKRHLISKTPKAPPRMDLPVRINDGVVVVDDDDDDNGEKHTNDINNNYTYNYDRYANNKTIGHILFVIALFTSNVMQMRTLVLQKQRDGIWIGSIVLVCISIVLQLGLSFILYILVKGDIRQSKTRTKLERCNIFGLIITLIVTLLNITINVLMLTINSKSFLDTRSLELLQTQN